jgi:hypothetical protein
LFCIGQYYKTFSASLTSRGNKLERLSFRISNAKSIMKIVVDDKHTSLLG